MDILHQLRKSVLANYADKPEYDAALSCRHSHQIPDLEPLRLRLKQPLGVPREGPVVEVDVADAKSGLPHDSRN